MRLPNADSHTHRYRDTDGYSNCFTDSYADSNTYTYTDAVHGQMCTHAEATPNPAPSPDAALRGW